MTSYREEDFLQVSGLQHFAFCRRQWALIHIESLWAENYNTIDGGIMHTRAHNEALFEKRGDLIITRGVRIASARLGVAGQCDVLEFHRNPSGVSLIGQSDRWLPYPVEYKRGKPKFDPCDALQLCAQAMCLEEMLCCDISEGALFYGETRRREIVSFSSELRSQVEHDLAEMHQLMQRGYTPMVKPHKGCSACSLKELCLPKLCGTQSVRDYLRVSMEETT